MSQLISPLMMAPSKPDAMRSMSSPSAVLQSTSIRKSAHARLVLLIMPDQARMVHMMHHHLNSLLYATDGTEAFFLGPDPAASADPAASLAFSAKAAMLS